MVQAVYSLGFYLIIPGLLEIGARSAPWIRYGTNTSQKPLAISQVPMT
jgi:hypothetical protein